MMLVQGTKGLGSLSKLGPEPWWNCSLYSTFTRAQTGLCCCYDMIQHIYVSLIWYGQLSLVHGTKRKKIRNKEKLNTKMLQTRSLMYVGKRKGWICKATTKYVKRKTQVLNSLCYGTAYF